MPSNNYCKRPRTAGELWKAGRILLAVLGACLCLPSLWAQGNQYLNAEAPQKLVAKRGASAEAKIAVSIQPGFHVNSNTPSADYLIPLKLTWTPGGALEPGEVVFPEAANGEVRVLRGAALGFHRRFRFDRQVQGAGRTCIPGTGHHARQIALSGMQQQLLFPAENGGSAALVPGAMRLVGQTIVFCGLSKLRSRAGRRHKPIDCPTEDPRPVLC
jgi:hypothetical protein